MSKSENYGNLLQVDEKTQKEYINHLHHTENLSIIQIAEKCGSYPNKIRRLAKKLGVQVNNRSQAQANALKTGRVSHPTEGKKHSEATKIKISEKVANSWDNLDETEREKRAQMAKDRWDDMPDYKKEEFYRLANEAVRKTSVGGSKLEKSVLNSLLKAGYHVEFHKTHSLANQRLHLDLFMPKDRIAIEIDGPSHFLPIWGEEALRKTKITDTKKDGLVLGCGLCILRIRTEKSLTNKVQRDIIKEITKCVGQITSKFPEPGNRRFVIHI